MTINLATPTVVNVGSGVQRINSLVSNDLVNLSGTLMVATSSQFTQNLTLLGGEVIGGTLKFTGGSKLTATPSAVTLAGVTLDGGLDASQNSSRLSVTGGLTVDCTATLGGGASNFGFLQFGDRSPLYWCGDPCPHDRYGCHCSWTKHLSERKSKARQP